MADLTTRAYFESERGYLRELGAEFARAHPELAWMLLDERSDPSVERLLQGVAFLTGRIRRRLDDDLPELSQGVLQILWPQLLRPIPAMAIQQFTSGPGESRLIKVPRESRLGSVPVRAAPDAEPLSCVFRTTTEVEIPPLSVTDARVLTQGSRSALHLSLKLNPGLDLSRVEQIPLKRLRFYLHADGRLPGELLYFLLKRVAADRPPVAYGPGPRERALSVPLPRPRAVGFAPDQGLLPGWESAPDGWRLLFEYFALPEKFLFFDVVGLGALAKLGAASEFTIEFLFDGLFPRELTVNASALRLGCTPVVNLFPRSGDPFRRLPLRSEHRVMPEGNEHRRFEIYSIDEVAGTATGRARAVYRPLLEVVAAPTRQAERWYDTRVRRDALDAGIDVWMALSPPEDSRDLERDEKFSLNLTCCNGRLPAELRAGDIRTALTGAPRGVATTNLRAPTPRVCPPLGKGLDWRVISHLALTRETLAQRETLSRLLTLHNLPAGDLNAANEVHRKRLDAIREVSLRPRERLVALHRLPGAPALGSAGVSRRTRALTRGLELTLSVSFEKFGGTGEIFLFGLVFERALALAASINSFSALTLRDADEVSASIRFAPRLGGRSLI